jgi:hypothetical protein
MAKISDGITCSAPMDKGVDSARILEFLQDAEQEGINLTLS